MSAAVDAITERADAVYDAATDIGLVLTDADCAAIAADETLDASLETLIVRHLVNPLCEATDAFYSSFLDQHGFTDWPSSIAIVVAFLHSRTQPSCGLCTVFFRFTSTPQKLTA